MGIADDTFPVAFSVVLAEPSEELNVQAGDSVVVEGPRTVAWENRESMPAEIVVVTAMVG